MDFTRRRASARSVYDERNLERNECAGFRLSFLLYFTATTCSSTYDTTLRLCASVAGLRGPWCRLRRLDIAGALRGAGPARRGRVRACSLAQLRTATDVAAGPVSIEP